MKGLKSKIRDNHFLKYFLIISNWVFQGIIHADMTEKIYKISFSLLFSGIFFYITVIFFDIALILSVLLSFIIGHTINWVINGNFHNIIIHRLSLSKLDKNRAFNYLKSLSERLTDNNSILYVTTHGSICSGKLKSTSDIDVAVVRKKGFINALRGLYIVVRERKIADWKKIPLEIYLCDSPQNAINRFKNERNPVVIFNPKNILDKYYSEKLSLSEAKKLNGV